MVRGRNISVGGPVGLFVKFTVVLVFFRLFADVACPATFVVAAAGAGGTRPKRQLPPLEQGDQVIDNIFQIPISTLNAVGSLIKSTRPLIRKTRERIQQYYAGGQQKPLQQQQQQQQSQNSYGRPGPVQQYYSAAQNSYVYGNIRRKQQRYDPPPQARDNRHGIQDY